jgi:dipeptidyl aminopeptidase/acylaminoacyl peptidase
MTRTRVALYRGAIFFTLVIAFTGAFTRVAMAQTKRPLQHRDYDGWNSIQSQVLSRDGKFIAYALFPEDGDGALVVRNLTTGKELRESAGSPPPAQDNTDVEAGAGQQGAVRTIRITFTHDNRFVIASAFPPKADTDKARKERKRADEMPRASMLIVDLAAMTVERVADVANFQVPENGESFVAYLKGPKAGAAPAGDNPADNNDGDRTYMDQGRGGRGGQASGGRGRRNEYGSDLMVRDLRSASLKERTVEDVIEYSISKDAKTLVYAVASKKEETDGLYSIVPGSEAAASTLLAGKGRYSKITWDANQRELAFLSDRDDAASKPAKFKVYLWNRGGTPVETISAATPGFKSSFGIFERGAMSFSRDGSRLFVSSAPLDEIAALDRESQAGRESSGSASAPAAGDEHVLADLWSWKDDYVQPMQKVRAAQDRSRSYRGVLNIADKKFVQVSDVSMAGLTPSDDGRMALGTDDREYRHMVDYDGTYNDVYLVDTATGARKLAFKQYRGGGGGGRGGGGLQFSPDGKYILAFKDKKWWSVESGSGKMMDLSGGIVDAGNKKPVAFYNEEHDTPDEPGSYGSAGWTKDGKWALINDEFDVWAVAPDASASRKLTNGRALKLQFRVARLDAPDPEEDRGIDPTKPLLFRVENIETRNTGFYSLASLQRGEPQKLLMGPKKYSALGKAKDADVVMVTATTFHDQPDIHITDSTFKQMKKVTDANPQQAQLLWGTGELIPYRNADGVALQAALYKPENFDPAKKYPMMIYIYERLTENVNNFVRPGPGTSINISYYVSNGYLVLTPDIVYTTGHPGQSALKCVLPAVQAVVDKGYVNRDAIGIQGHSWGGYQTAYLLTQTGLFRAAEAGAPVVNMISAYDGIRWGTGLPRQFQYEKTQSRIGGSIWEYPLRFVENSPIFMVDRITTPVLILENDGDDAVPWYQGLEFFLSLRRLGKEVYLWNYNGEKHGLRQRPTQKDYTVRMQQFFDYFLKGSDKPDWMTNGIPYIDREQEKEKINAVYGTSGDKKDIKQ